MKKIKQIIAAVTAAAALSTSAVIASAQWIPRTPQNEQEMKDYVEDIGCEMYAFIERYGLDAEISEIRKKKGYIGYNALWYFDPTLKPLFDDYFYFNEMDISRIVSGYPEDWQRKDWLNFGISGFIRRENLNAYCTYSMADEDTSDIIIAYDCKDTETREKIERFIEDSNYGAAEGVDIKFIAAGENSKPDEKITDKYEILLLLRKFIKDEGLKYISAYLDPAYDKVELCYSSTGWRPESREEGRAIRTTNAVLQYAKSVNIDTDMISCTATDDDLGDAIEVEDTKPITAAWKIRNILQSYVKQNDLDAEVFDIDKINEEPTDLPASQTTYPCTETAGYNSSDDKQFVGVCYIDPAVREKIEAYMKEREIDSSRVLMYDHFDTGGRVNHEAVQIRMFMRENGINAYQKWRQRASTLTICYWDTDKDKIKLIEDFVKERCYDKRITIEYKEMKKHSGKITDADEAYAMLYDFCFRDNIYLADSIVYSPQCEKMTLYIADEWSGIDSESAIDKFIKDNKIDSRLIDKVYITRSIEDDVIPPTTRIPAITDLPTIPIDTKGTMKGDADLNGEVSLSDVIVVSKYTLNSTLYPFPNETAKQNADMNSDNTVDALDTAALIETQLG